MVPYGISNIENIHTATNNEHIVLLYMWVHNVLTEADNGYTVFILFFYIQQTHYDISLL